MDLAGRNIIIAGAGIGGLATALALLQRGAEVTVLEQAEAITEVGAGLQISPNGFAVLRALGLGEAVKSRAVRGQAVSLRDHARGEVLRLDLTRLADQRYLFVHRADLIDILAGAARGAGAQVRLLQKVAAVAPGDVPSIAMANEAQMHADLVIGADGLHSRLREALNGKTAPFFTGQAAWRAVVPNAMGRVAEAWVHMGPGRHLVSYPLRGGDFVNIVAVEERRSWVAEGWHHRADPEGLRAAFADFGEEAQALLGAVDEVHLWGLFRHEVAPCWQLDNTVLVGDAAHPTLPFLAQGANMALEDAWVLAECLAAMPDQSEALAAYQARRIDRVRKVIAAANGNAWKYHLRPGPLRSLAHAALKLGGKLAPGPMLRQFDWLYLHDVTAGAGES